MQTLQNSKAGLGASSWCRHGAQRSTFPLVVFVLSILSLRAQIVINEINHRPAKDDRTEFVELYNSGTETVELSGWKFVAGIKYNFAQGASLKPDGYLVLARDTNQFQRKFGFPASGQFQGRLGRRTGRLVLDDAKGQVQDEVNYSHGFPWPLAGAPAGSSIELIHPSLNNALAGSWRSCAAVPPSVAGATTNGFQPTPGARNSVFQTNSPPQIVEVRHVPASPRSGEPVSIQVRLADPNGVSKVTLEYQVVEPGKYVELQDAAYRGPWTSMEMIQPTPGDGAGSTNNFRAILPAEIQKHRRLVRYRVRAEDKLGTKVMAPYADDSQPNFAYFVYDGVPAWRGAAIPGGFNPFSPSTKVVEFGTNVMRSLPVYHLIAKKTAVEQAQFREQYPGKEYKWIGTLVYDGKVYDHVRFRARGGGWRYAMGKNMWKFSFNRGHEFQASDNHGQMLPETWSKLNLGACIQQADYGQRGEQGMFEAVGFRLFNLAGVEGPETHWVQLRVIDEADESRSQYQGDFWGLYLAVEQMDGNFLDAHKLPDGNLFKMEFGAGELNNRGEGQPANRSDLMAFMQAYQHRQQPDEWWRANFDLDRYYSYRAIVECIHHYDIDEDAGKNYFYYRNPDTGRWSVHPWDIDLSWSDSMYGGGMSPFRNRVLPRPAFRVEYQNRVREIRDLLFNTDQAWQLIDEYAALISDPAGGLSMVQADRAMWDYNPILGDSGKSMPGKSGQGLFYQASPTQDFPGMVKLMKSYVERRGKWMDARIANDPAIPSTPTIRSTGPKNFPPGQLRFESSAFSGAAEFGTIEWRLGEVTDPKAPGFHARSPRHYEIQPVWTSGRIKKTELQSTIPAGIARSGHTYRARVRMFDSAGRASHWSAPVQFTTSE